MADTTIKKVQSARSPKGPDGQVYLASGKHVAMRLWAEDAKNSESHTREYETVGFVLNGKATLEVEGQRVTLEPGDSWVVPAGASHRYLIDEAFEAVEATSPPARVAGRDE